MTKTRVPNKTQWALDDIVAASRRGRRALKKVLQRAEQRPDPLMLLWLLDLSDALAIIQEKAVGARHGEYVEYQE